MMDNTQQSAFTKLRPPCIALSQAALQFRGRQATVKSVLLSLQKAHHTILELGDNNALDSKLAEYAFFPLSHIFNEAQRLSFQCVELAVRCLHILVTKGWKEKIAPEMGKQLLILLCLLAGSSPAQKESPPDDLKVVCHQAINALICSLSKSGPGNAIFDDTTSHSVVDQVAYLSVEAITDSASAPVQLAALEALTKLITIIVRRSLLASILPRTVSGLTKALRPSTRARGTPAVLAANVKVLTLILRNVLSDEVVFPAAQQYELAQSLQAHTEDGQILDASWLKATASQVRLALLSVSKLYYHDSQQARDALEKLCIMVLCECPKSLSDSTSIMLETLVILATFVDTTTPFAELKWLITTNPCITEALRSSLHTWSLSLPRLMQGSEDRPKQRALAQVSVVFNLLALATDGTESLTHLMATTLLDSVSATLQTENLRLRKPLDDIAPTGVRMLDLPTQQVKVSTSFEPVILSHRSQEASTKALKQLLAALANDRTWRSLGRMLINRVWGAPSNLQLASVWLVVNLLQSQRHQMDLDSMLNESYSSSASLPDLISELYSSTLPFLLDSPSQNEHDWRLTAVALECTVMQAQQLGESYRPELVETLYPLLSLLRSRHEGLRLHAVTALNLLASACSYSSAQEMLVANVDYLVNSIGIKLNSFDISPAAPQVLIVMVRLCGARLLPYLDDLIDSVFTALDNFHGYPKLVEMLFEVLKSIVDESVEEPRRAIPDGKSPKHDKTGRQPSEIADILSDLATAQKCRLQDVIDHQDRVRSFPHQPWSSTEDISRTNYTSQDNTFSKPEGDSSEISEEAVSSNTDIQRQLSKPHKLLLSIAQATAPHFASPAPNVRLTLLKLLHRITPLIAQDEDSFLPLINDVWPSIVDRLFGDQNSDGDGEAVYNICAAAEVVAQLCEGAGDFMSSRIANILPNLEKMYRDVYLRIENRNASNGEDRTASVSSSHSLGMHRKLAGTVTLQVIEAPAETATTLRREVTDEEKLTVPFPTRTSDVQIFNSLILVLISVLKYVRIGADTGDSIVSLLSVVMDKPGHEGVRQALECWNQDVLWLVRETQRRDIGLQSSVAAFGHDRSQTIRK